MSRGKLVAFLLIAAVAVVLGVLLGKSCCTPGDAQVGAADAGQVALRVVDAGSLAMDHIVDAGAVAVASDAGNAADHAPDAMPIVAPKDRHPRVASSDHADHAVHAVPDKVIEKAPQPPQKEPEHDAGVVVVAAAVVDAGQASAPDAGPRSVHQDLTPDAMPSAPLTVTYEDAAVSAFMLLRQVRVFVDGKRVSDETSDKGIEATKPKVMYSGALFPGTHQVRVEVVYKGKGNGVFNYMEAYTFRLRPMTVIHSKENTPVTVNAVVHDKGALQEFQNRADLQLTVAP